MSRASLLSAAVIGFVGGQGAAIDIAFATGACPAWTSDGSFASGMREYNRSLEGKQRQSVDLRAAELMKAEVQQFAKDRFEGNAPGDFQGERVAERLRERLANKLPQYATDLRAMDREQLNDCIPYASAIFTATDEKLRQEQQAEYAVQHPEATLLKAYHDYIGVRACQKARDGYDEVYVTDAEVEDAKQLAKAIEDTVREKQPSVDKDKVWAEADSLKLEELVDKKEIEWMNTSAQQYVLALRYFGAAAVKSGKFDQRGETFCSGLITSLQTTANELGLVRTHKKDF